MRTVSEQKEARDLERQKEFKALTKFIPAGVRRHVEEEAYWEYAAKQGKPRTSAIMTTAQHRDANQAREYLKRPSVVSQKAYTEYESRRKAIAAYKKGFLATGVVQAEFARIHEGEEP
jgi:hypothetical protein